jgi:hypothetical protein
MRAELLGLATRVLFSRSFFAIADAKTDAQTREERDHAESSDRIFTGVSGPKADYEDGDRHGDADVRIPD